MGAYVGKGEFRRDTNYITTRITADGRDGYPVEPGRRDHRPAAVGPGRCSLHWILRSNP
jgi:hypothetical protein